MRNFVMHEDFEILVKSHNLNLPKKLCYLRNFEVQKILKHFARRVTFFSFKTLIIYPFL